LPRRFTTTTTTTTTTVGESTAVTPERDYVHQLGAIASGRRLRRYPSDMTDAEWAEARGGIRPSLGT
jgi:hypothetical protein